MSGIVVDVGDRRIGDGFGEARAEEAGRRLETGTDLAASTRRAASAAAKAVKL
jgi:hypothetical protein